MHGHVVRTEQLTPSMVRVVLGGGDLAGFMMVDATDAYVNLAFPPPGAGYAGGFDPRAVKDTRPREEWPARRRYTVRRWDEATRELTIDFVVHGHGQGAGEGTGDDGVAGAWASCAAVGDVLVLDGPGGGYRPDSTADWHLMIGDESALPAIAASLEVLAADAVAVVRIVCDGPEHELPLPSAAAVELRWLHRSGTSDDAALLVRSLRSLDFLPGTVHPFVHGEAEEVRAVRRHLLAERQLPRTGMSCSPYWRRSMTDEAWRQVKRDFVADMEADVA